MKCTKLKMLTSKYDNPYISEEHHFQDCTKNLDAFYLLFLKAGKVYQSALPVSQFLTAIIRNSRLFQVSISCEKPLSGLFSERVLGLG